MKRLYSFVSFLFLAVAVVGCAAQPIQGTVLAPPWPPSPTIESPRPPDVIVEPREDEINRVLQAYRNGDSDAIHQLLRGYLSVNNEEFIADLIHGHAGLSLRFAAVAVEKNDPTLFLTICRVASSNERDAASLRMLASMHTAWQKCGHLAVEAMRVYQRTQRNINAVSPYKMACPALDAVF